MIQLCPTLGGGGAPCVILLTATAKSSRNGFLRSSNPGPTRAQPMCVRTDELLSAVLAHRDQDRRTSIICSQRFPKNTGDIRQLQGSSMHGAGIFHNRT